MLRENIYQGKKKWPEAMNGGFVMQAFVLNLDKGGTRYECFVQQLAGEREDIFIVNFKDSSLIRLFHASKVLFYVSRTKADKGNAMMRRKESRLEERLWHAIAENEAVN
jgi:hypothetical protein